MGMIKNIFKKPFIVLLLLLMSMNFLSCSDDSSTDASANGGGIKIFTLQKDIFLSNAIQRYNLYHSEEPIEVINFENLDEYKTRLSSEVMAGKGPDVVYFNNYTIGSLYKVLESGAFYDMQLLMAEDSSFDASVFHPVVFNAGMYKDKRYFIPVSYSVPLFLTTKEALSRSGIDLSGDGLSYNEFLGQIDNYVAVSGVSSGKYVFSHPMSLESFVSSTGLSFVDYANKQVSYDNTYIDIVDDFVRLSQLFCPNEEREQYKLQEYDLMKNRNALFLNSNYTLNPNSIALNVSYLKNLLSETPEVYAFPTYSGEKKYYASTEQCVAINSNSKNKQAAYEFVKILLSENMQTSDFFMFLPVNNKAFNTMIDSSAIRNSTAIYNGLSFTQEPLSSEFAASYKAIIENITVATFYDSGAESAIYTPLASYFEGTLSREKCIDEMKKRMLLYLNE